MKVFIEKLRLEELQSFLREQAEDTFPDLKDTERLSMLSQKWHSYAEFCTCRDESSRLVGMIAFYANHPEGRVTYIPHVYVSPNFRRQGVFKQMLEKVQYVATERGFSELRLEVEKTNFLARQSYLSNGFCYFHSNDIESSSYYMFKTIGQKSPIKNKKNE